MGGREKGGREGVKKGAGREGREKGGREGEGREGGRERGREGVKKGAGRERREKGGREGEGREGGEESSRIGVEREEQRSEGRTKVHICSLSLSIISTVSSSMNTSLVGSGPKKGTGSKLSRNLSRGSIANWSTLRLTSTTASCPAATLSVPGELTRISSETVECVSVCVCVCAH